MSVESQILGIKITSISKILGKSKNQIDKQIYRIESRGELKITEFRCS